MAHDDRVMLEMTDREAEILEAHLQSIINNAGGAPKFRAWAGTLKGKVAQAREVYRQRRQAARSRWEASNGGGDGGAGADGAGEHGADPALCGAGRGAG